MSDDVTPRHYRRRASLPQQGFDSKNSSSQPLTPEISLTMWKIPMESRMVVTNVGGNPPAGHGSEWRDQLLSSLNDAGVTRPPRHRVIGIILPVLLLIVVAAVWTLTFKVVDHSFRGPDLV